MRKRGGAVFSAIAGLFLTIALFIGVIGFQANEDRWHQGPIVFVLTPSHGLHEMDVLFIGAATGSAVIALVAALFARR